MPSLLIMSTISGEMTKRGGVSICGGGQRGRKCWEELRPEGGVEGCTQPGSARERLRRHLCNEWAMCRCQSPLMPPHTQLPQLGKPPGACCPPSPQRPTCFCSSRACTCASLYCSSRSSTSFFSRWLSLPILWGRCGGCVKVLFQGTHTDRPTQQCVQRGAL